MAIYLTNAKAIAALNAAVSGADTLVLYSDSVPNDADDNAGAPFTAVATCTISSVGTAVDTTTGSAQVTLTVDDDTNTAGGTAQFFRVLDGATVLLQGTVGNTSSFDLNLNDTAIPVAATLSISSFTLTLPELGS